MTKKETIKILAMLSAYFGQGKADPQEMANAWHLILKDYNYAIAQKAVVEFARNDTREYCTFPPVGSIVRAVEAQGKLANRVFNTAFHNGEYKDMPNGAKRLITESEYETLLNMSQDELKEREQSIKDALMGKLTTPLLEG